MNARVTSLSLIAAVAATIAITGTGSVPAIGGSSMAATAGAEAASTSGPSVAKPGAAKRDSARRGAGRAEASAAASSGQSARCAGCAVVESIRRIDRREDAGGMCAVADGEALSMRTIRAATQSSNAIATLDETALAALGGRPGAKKTRIATSYQIVVRFRDGSRRVFNEVTPRSLQTGDRIQVIAGAY